MKLIKFILFGTRDPEAEHELLPPEHDAGDGGHSENPHKERQGTIQGPDIPRRPPGDRHQVGQDVHDCDCTLIAKAS